MIRVVLFIFHNRWKRKQAEKVLLTNLDCILSAVFGSLSSDAFSLPSRPKCCSVSDVKLKLIHAQRQTIRLGSRVNEKKTNLSISSLCRCHQNHDVEELGQWNTRQHSRFNRVKGRSLSLISYIVLFLMSDSGISLKISSATVRVFRRL